MNDDILRHEINSLKKEIHERNERKRRYFGTPETNEALALAARKQHELAEPLALAVKEAGLSNIGVIFPFGIEPRQRKRRGSAPKGYNSELARRLRVTAYLLTNG